ncbi:anaerobic C4-dicarboxylate transporter [Edwardsiella piscicida]|uniref:C4-dicarboxylate transporter n=3 Tax=Edwardsiella TaxID=635 RepID=A0A0H3DR85_EDWTF|nr:anaerobic C4-dicarboxylate transporter family protein [Edwardsiella piscicida]ACY83765.1 anaerobic C4-dicarboxylate transporter DcuA [Edwardsiella tarda EIB202]ADM40976.1 Anaerobic C4-dicarboxylate transporter [Edwardsiella tarda FL6-60]AGH73010.1 anaerobic C4-dicarboxylate transporter [Edwardsiella piscicida C07-087]AOP42368.1 anaerobic C4-dicarboxylate transporter [Edwardsiella piscicida]ARD17457.1 C4-dicarboxylate ABC transporter [Edwardsiella piscicida]
MVWLEIIVVLGAIFFGIRMGGIGIGLCGGLGLAILTLGLGLPIGSAPVDVILIIMTVVVAASALQAAGGMDYLVRLAGTFMRRNPRYINIIAPIITWSMTIMAGTGFIVFSTLPVIAEVAKDSGIRPSRTLAGSVVASQIAISGSPISAAMAAMLTIMEGNGITFIQVMAICLPASFVAAMVAALIASRQGCELQDDEVYLARLQKGLVSKYQEKQNVDTPQAKRAVALFLLATVAIVILAAFPQLRPGFDIGKPMGTRDIIIICMLSCTCLMVPLCKTNGDAIVMTPTFRSGMSSLAVILGIVTLGTTFVDAHMDQIKFIAGDVLRAYPMLLALVLFLTCALLYSQGATTPLIIPLAIALDVPIWAILASYVAVTGVFVLPTYPTSLAAMEFDTTGSTRVGKYIVNHPFMLPGLGGIAAGVAFGFLIAPLVV